MKMFIWTRSLDHLQLHTWRAVQARLDQQITFVLTEPENLARRQQGWPPVDLSDLDVITMKDKGWWAQSTDIIRQNPEAFHVFWGFWSERRFFPLIVYAVNYGIKTAVLNEHYSVSPAGYMGEENPFIAQLKVILRPFLYHLAALILKYSSRKGSGVCIFPISLEAQQQYIRAGFDKNALFPFGIFVPRMAVTNGEEKRSDHIRLVFVGALRSIKGLDIAINALKKLNQNGLKVSLEVYGSGDPARFIPTDDCTAVTYKGMIPIEKAQAVIAQYDALVLPSRHDGWGAVVNEALLQGTPVIVSDRVGAKCLVESSDTGLVFRSEDVNDLAEKIDLLIKDSSLLEKFRVNALKIDGGILPETGAQYFLDVLSYYFSKVGSRPSAVWNNDPLCRKGEA
jgi:glycosyltransferase involved in cell wall biosynthesis